MWQYGVTICPALEVDYSIDIRHAIGDPHDGDGS